MSRTAVGIGLGIALALAPANAEEPGKLPVPDRVQVEKQAEKTGAPSPGGISREKGKVGPAQVKPELREQKRPLLDRPALQQARPRFSCFVRRMSLPPWEGTEWEGVWLVEFGIVNNARANEVKVVVELWAWNEVSGSFRRYPGVSPDSHEYTDFSPGHPYSERFERLTLASVSGCHLDAENPQKVHCKYRVTADVSFRQDSGGSPMPGPGRPSSSSSAWEDGAHCEDTVSWSVTE